MGLMNDMFTKWRDNDRSLTGDTLMIDIIDTKYVVGLTYEANPPHKAPEKRRNMRITTVGLL